MSFNFIEGDEDASLTIPPHIEVDENIIGGTKRERKKVSCFILFFFFSGRWRMRDGL